MDIFSSLPKVFIPGYVLSKLIDDVIAKIDHEYIVIRSTIPVGYCDSKNVFFMPEFLTEKNFINDFINNKDWIFGLLNGPKDEEFKLKIQI